MYESAEFLADLRACRDFCRFWSIAPFVKKSKHSRCLLVGCFLVDWAREPPKKILQTAENVRSNPNENSLFSKKRSPFWEKAIALFFQPLVNHYSQLIIKLLPLRLLLRLRLQNLLEFPAR